jgi:hypothetical protein
MVLVLSGAQPRGFAIVVVLVALLTVLCAPTANAAQQPVPPAVSFNVRPDLIVCGDLASPRAVTASWQITHDVSLAVITGGVALHGEAPKPVVIVRRRHRRPVHGTTRLYVLCTGSNQQLQLQASGRGGSSTAGAVVHEVHTA